MDDTILRLLTVLTEVVQEMNGLDIEVEFFEPMQRLLDLCRSSKTLSRYLNLCFNSSCPSNRNPGD